MCVPGAIFRVLQAAGRRLLVSGSGRNNEYMMGGRAGDDNPREKREEACLSDLWAPLYKHRAHLS